MRKRLGGAVALAGVALCLSASSAGAAAQSTRMNGYTNIGQDSIDLVAFVEANSRACQAGRKVIFIARTTGEQERLGVDRTNSNGVAGLAGAQLPGNTQDVIAIAPKTKVSKRLTCREGSTGMPFYGPLDPVRR